MNIFTLIKSLLTKINGNSPRCRIEEIDLTNQTIIIHCRGMDAPVKLSFDEIMNDAVILTNLSSKQAAWIGYYYGKYYDDLIQKNDSPETALRFDLDNSSNLFNIIMLNRRGDLIYTNKNSNTTHTISPIKAVTDERFVGQFDSIQACYIGMLAGTAYSKKKSEKIFC